MPAAMRSGTDEYKKQLSTRERAYEKASKSGITFREKNIAMDFIGLDIEKIMSSIDRADDPESMARFALDYAEKLGGAVPPGTMKQLREKLNAMEKTKDVAKKMPKRPGVPKKKELTYDYGPAGKALYLPEDLEKIGFAEVESIGSENVYLKKDGKNYWFKAADLGLHGEKLEEGERYDFSRLSKVGAKVLSE